LNLIVLIVFRQFLLPRPKNRSRAYEYSCVLFGARNLYKKNLRKTARQTRKFLVQGLVQIY